MYNDVHSINKLGEQNLVKYALIKPKMVAIMTLFPL
jgi:hypothetical protein